MPKLPARLLPALLWLAACAGPTVTVRQECQPINRYDTRCEVASREAAAPRAPKPITLTRSHTVVYELTGHGQAQVVQMTTDASNNAGFGDHRFDDADTPWRLEVAAPAGMTPLLRYQPDSDINCKITIDGQDVTGEFPKSNMSGNGTLTVCGATREP